MNILKNLTIALFVLSLCVFAKSPDGKFAFIQQDLNDQSSTVGSNPDLDELMKTANRIGIMNDRCRSISLTEPLDESCQTFYKVTLSEFEKKYSQVTGNIRIGSMQLKDGVQNRIANINACVDALMPFFVSHSSVLELNGDIVDVIPLDDMGCFRDGRVYSGCGALSSVFRMSQNQKFRGEKKTLTSKGVDGTWIWF